MEAASGEGSATKARSNSAALQRVRSSLGLRLAGCIAVCIGCDVLSNPVDPGQAELSNKPTDLYEHCSFVTAQFRRGVTGNSSRPSFCPCSTFC